MSDIIIREGVRGTWFYHLGRTHDYLSLCGEPSMFTSLPRSTWGHVGHLNERYCRKCKKLADEIEGNLSK
jgi:hypothetical protein